MLTCFYFFPLMSQMSISNVKTARTRSRQLPTLLLSSTWKCLCLQRWSKWLKIHALCWEAAQQPAGKTSLLEPWAPADHHPRVLPCSKFSITLVLCWLWGPEYKGDRFLALRSAITLPMNNMDAISENCYCINLFKVVDSTKIQLNNDLSNFSVRLEISIIFQRQLIRWQNARQTSYNISYNLLVPTLKGRKIQA